MRSRQLITGSVIAGVAGSAALILLFFTLVTLISGFDFAKDQFFKFWYFLIALSLGFGIQLGIYYFLRKSLNQHPGKKIMTATGTTSTVAMISCCSHYLANILPVIGTAGLITIVSQYQVELFWFGIAANILGIFYMVSKLIKAQPIL